MGVSLTVEDGSVAFGMGIGVRAESFLENAAEQSSDAVSLPPLMHFHLAASINAETGKLEVSRPTLRLYVHLFDNRGETF